jgi:hypothetical protein
VERLEVDLKPKRRVGRQVHWENTAVLASSKAEVSYVFHRNDIDRLQTITVDIKRIHSVDIVSIGIGIYIIYFKNKIFA